MRLPKSNSAFGKAVIVSAWVAVSAGVGSLIALAVPALEMSDLAWVAPIVNVVLVAIRNFADKQVDNF